jgi:hypothetical protein
MVDGEGRSMKDKWLVTIEIDTYDGDPARWDWDYIFTSGDEIKIISSDFKGRVFPSEGESE